MINGKKIAEQMYGPLQKKVASLAEKRGRPPRLVAVTAGEDTGIKKFLAIKKKAGERLGIDFRMRQFPENISTRQLRKELAAIARSKMNDGMLIELPLPGHMNTQYLLNSIPEKKDVDVLSQKAQGSFFTGRSSILPPAVEAIKQILNEEQYRDSAVARGKNVVVFGYGLLVGKPVSHWFMQNGATVLVVNEFTPHPEQISREADIVVSGVGKRDIITADMVKKDALVIDFGFSAHNGRIVGDVDFESVSKKTKSITPVPGGVGPLVVAGVLKNLIILMT